MFSACRNPVLLPEVEVLMVPASLQGTRLPDLGPRRGPGGLGQSLDQDLNLDPDQEGVLAGIIQDHAHVLDPIGDQEADLIAVITAADTVTAILLCLLVGVMLATEQILIQTVVLVCLD